MTNIYKQKYLKYKFKYSELKYQLGGNIHNFNNFLVTMFIPEELSNKDKLYLFVGTFPYIYFNHQWKAGESYKMVENSIEYNLIIN